MPLRCVGCGALLFTMTKEEHSNLLGLSVSRYHTEARGNHPREQP